MVERAADISSQKSFPQNNIDINGEAERLIYLDKSYFRELIDKLRNNYFISLVEIGEACAISKERIHNLYYSDRHVRISLGELESIENLEERVLSGKYKQALYSEKWGRPQKIDMGLLKNTVFALIRDFGLTIVEIERACGFSIHRLSNLMYKGAYIFERELAAIINLRMRIETGNYIVEGDKRLKGHKKIENVVFDKNALKQLIIYYKAQYGLSMAAIENMANLPKKRLSNLRYNKRYRNMRKSEIDALWGLAEDYD